jgi:hypothetical protein
MLLLNRLLEEAISINRLALETAALMLGGDKSRAYRLEGICADFLAGVSLGTGNQGVLYHCLTRLVASRPRL